MDHALIQLVARIKIRIRQDKGISVNTQRFFADAEYTRQVLDLAEESEDIELVSTALEIRNRLGWLNLDDRMNPAPATAPRATGTQGGSTDKERYRFGARS